tara:strand:- start:277 stop:591 length:315 start_codon:yes stop_codon:yes gene_type:complete
MSNQPISEEYRIVAKNWVDAEAAASLLEDTKSAVLAQKMAALGDMPVSKAEMQVKASDDWTDFIEKMVEARKRANLLKVQLEYIRMRSSEWSSFEASKRAEMRL